MATACLLREDTETCEAPEAPVCVCEVSACVCEVSACVCEVSTCLKQESHHVLAQLQADELVILVEWSNKREEPCDCQHRSV